MLFAAASPPGPSSSVSDPCSLRFWVTWPFVIYKNKRARGRKGHNRLLLFFKNILKPSRCGTSSVLGSGFLLL